MLAVREWILRIWMHEWLWSLTKWLAVREWILPIWMHEWCWSLNEWLAVGWMNTAYLYVWMALISDWMAGCWLNEYCLSVCMNDADLWMKDWVSIVEWILPICMHEWCWSLNEGLAVCCRMNTAYLYAWLAVGWMNTAYLYAWMALISDWMAGCWLNEWHSRGWKVDGIVCMRPAPPADVYGKSAWDHAC